MFGINKIKEDIEELKCACFGTKHYEVNGVHCYDSQVKSANQRIDDLEITIQLLFDYLKLELEKLPEVPSKTVVRKKVKDVKKL